MGAQFFAVYVAASYVEGNHSANRALQMIDTVRHDIIEQLPQRFRLRHHRRRYPPRPPSSTRSPR